MAHSKNFIDISGEIYGKLKVVSYAGKNKSGNSKWLCVCECNIQKVVEATKLRSGHTKSCGCLKSSREGLSKTRIYRIWKCMLSRCDNYENDNYYWYGFKGISVCDLWRDFKVFYDWSITNGYQEDLTIDRIDSNGNYSPENCRWISQKEQCNNVSSNHVIVYKNKSYSMAQFADLLGYDYWTVSNRIKLGWTPDEIASVEEVRR